MGLIHMMVILAIVVMIAAIGIRRGRPMRRLILVALMLAILIGFLLMVVGWANSGIDAIMLGLVAGIVFAMILVRKTRSDDQEKLDPEPIFESVPRPKAQPLIVEPEAKTPSTSTRVRMNTDDEP